MVEIKNKRRAALLLAGCYNGEKLKVEVETDQGVTVSRPSGEKLYFPLPFLDLWLLRMRGRGV